MQGGRSREDRNLGSASTWLVLTALGRDHIEGSRPGAPTERGVTLTGDENSGLKGLFLRVGSREGIFLKALHVHQG